MARFCKECGAEIPEGVSFCNACGASVQQQSVQPQQTVMAQPAVSPQPVQQAPLADGTVGTGYFFGMMLVYAIPIVGWIACILTALKGKHQTKKNFAKAMMIWLIIGLVLSLIMGAVITWLGTLLVSYINELAAAELGTTEIGEFQDLLNQLQQFEGGENTLPVE